MLSSLLLIVSLHATPVNNYRGSGRRQFTTLIASRDGLPKPRRATGQGSTHYTPPDNGAPKRTFPGGAREV